MSELSIGSRVAGLQVPLSRILTLATAAARVLDEAGEIENEADRRDAENVVNFIDLIAEVARQASSEADAIERDAHLLSKDSQS